jgi:UDP-N-acetylmuramoylalanine--D-glutamate ligase
MAQSAEQMQMQTNKKRVLVIGLGKTGLSCARYLLARGYEVAVTDSREHPPALDQLREELPDVALFLGGFDEQAFAHADELVVSPGVSLKEPLIQAAMQRGVSVTGDVEIFAQAVHAPVIAITGSNGKSTVTSLVGVMAREDGRDARVGGNLGTPPLDMLQEGEPDLYVLELSSFQLEYTRSLHVQAAAVLNISEDHMDRYSSLNEYIEAKRRIFQHADVMVLNRDDPHVMAMADTGRKMISFGLDAPQPGQYGLRQREGAQWLCRGDEFLLAQSALLIPGLHNLANAMAALALGEAAGFDMQSMLRALQGFKGLPHRTQFVLERDGVRWYNDSKGTNIGAAEAALLGMPGKVVLIAGGEGKGADFTRLRDAVAQKARAVVLIGRDARLLEKALQGTVTLRHAADMEDAVVQARALAESGDAVLLSPACASFDMFRGFDHRGDVFMEAVRRLA